MLTVKHIADNGREFIVLARSVAYYTGYDNGPKTTDEERNSPHVIAFDIPHDPSYESSQASFDSGIVYVMNDTGKTVADYNLSFLKRKNQTA